MTDSNRLRSAYGIRLFFEPAFLRVALTVVLAIAVVVRLAQLLVYSGQEQWGFDFSAYWGAGQAVLDGRSPYSSHQLEGPYSPQFPQGLYIYPPFLAVVSTVLAAAFDDYRVANLAWATLGALILAISVIAVSRRERVVAPRDIVLVLMATFAFAPVIGELVMGNVHLLLLGLLTATWLALREGKPNLDLVGGALLGVATLIKVFPGFILLWLLLTGRHRAFVASVVTMAVLVVATVPFIGLGPWLEYPRVLLNLGPPQDVADVLAPTVWLSTVLPNLLARVLVIAVGIGAMVWATRNRSEPVSFAVAVTASVLIAPALYHHYLALLVLPMLIALRHSSPVLWLGVAYLLLSGGELEALGDLVWIVNRVLPTLGALLVLVGLLRYGARRPPGRAPSFT